MRVEVVVLELVGGMMGWVEELVVLEMMMLMLMEVVEPETMMPLHPSLFQETQIVQLHNPQDQVLGFLEDAWLELHQSSGYQCLWK
jgi:hypothetical protein